MKKKYVNNVVFAAEDVGEKNVRAAQPALRGWKGCRGKFFRPSPVAFIHEVRR